jgi:hypothetical protein
MLKIVLLKSASRAILTKNALQIKRTGLMMVRIGDRLPVIRPPVVRSVAESLKLVADSPIAHKREPIR